MTQDGTNGTGDGSGLTPRQIAALPYIVAGATLSEGARLANMGRGTLYRWMNAPQFRRALETTRAESADLARTELEGLMPKAAVVLAEFLEDPSPNVRLRAANTILALGLGLETLDIEELNESLDYRDDTMALLERKRPNRNLFNPSGS